MISSVAIPATHLGGAALKVPGDRLAIEMIALLLAAVTLSFLGGPLGLLLAPLFFPALVPKVAHAFTILCFGTDLPP
jgi:hypothetical protein